MKMTIRESGDGITHIVLNGRLDAIAEQEIDEDLAHALAKQRPAIVDLSDVPFMASRGIGLLIANGRRLQKSGQKMVLLNPQQLVARVLKTARVDLILPIVDELQDAVRILEVSSQHGSVGSPVESSQPAASQPAEPAQVVVEASESEVQLAIRNELSELEGLNTSVANFLTAHDVPHRAAYAMNLAIDELVVNVIRYAYVDDETHLINIELAMEGEQIILRIEDDGRPFDPRSGPALDLHAEDREAGGMGLLLVLDMVDRLKYRREGERNQVEVRIHCIPDEQGSDRSSGENGHVSSRH